MTEHRPTDPSFHAGAGDPDDAESFRWSELRHFLYAPLRRPLMVLVPWVAVFLVAVAGLWFLPKKFLSSALVLVESEKVPESFITKVVTRDPSQRLEAVKPEILSRTRLERVFQETQPYPGISKTGGVEIMRERISITLSGNDGFTISFYHHDPRKAQEVTDRLASLFIEETIKSREQQVEGAVDFLGTQMKEARTELEGKDAALRRFKEEHMGRLPSQLETNLATMQMLQRDAQAVEESLLFARVKQEALARGLGRASIAVPAGSGELADLARQLAALRARYTDAHPDVESLRSRIRRLEARLAEAAQAEAPPGSRPAEPDSSIAVTREQMERANVEIRNLERRQKDLHGRMAAISANVEETPRTEQELSTLTRDYDKLNENYTALLSKQLEAQMSGRLEHRWKRDQFRMLDPASLPEKPMFPRPQVFLPLGAILGLLAGIGASLVAEYLDSTVKDSEVLQAIQGYPLLASIPHLSDATPPRPPLAKLARATPDDEDRRRVAEMAWGPSQPGEAVFRHAGVAISRKAVPILETLNHPNSIVGEELRLFGSKLMDTCRRLKINCLALTSALPEEGKSTLSLGLASALGRKSGRRILLMDADLRRPSLTRMLGIPPTDGLSEFLNGTRDELPVWEVEPGGFFFMTAGRTGLDRPELMGSPRMDAVLRTARRLFDLVLLDAVPVLPVADTVLMQDLVDGFQLVVRSRTTPRDAIRDALAKLRPDRVIGVVFNAHQEYQASHRYYGYKRYGMSGASVPGRMARLRGGFKGRP